MGSDSFLVIVFIFVLLMVAWIVALIAGRAISKKKLASFRNYIAKKLPESDASREELLIAKQKSRQIRPDIALLIKDITEEIILLLDVKGTGITHKKYGFGELLSVHSTNQVIGRGFLSKTYSYEETLALTFTDGQTYPLILENTSNKSGSDQGADVVRNLFAPWKRRLNSILQAH